ncbi:4'-phosphopantetheinyl transferase superfamily protein [Streptomyces triculaminicus]|uniref:4'-phosphopantetheinyl transferase family protein n=1 Tax=Streptomyces triculaminicus TaxID=2816232 RepID=UPI0033E477E7
MPAVELVHADGPGGAWATSVSTAVREGRTVVLHCLVEEWKAPDSPELSLLLGREHRRYASTRHPACRDRFVASRRLIKYAASAALGVSPWTLELAISPGGRKYLRGCGWLGLSLSHTGDLLVLALSATGRVGADSEALSRSMCNPALVRRVCTDAEMEVLGALPVGERGRAMLRLWTLKEAYTKAIGVGMRLPFREFGFAVDGDRAVLHDAEGAPAHPVEWEFTTHWIDADDSYVVSTAQTRSPGHRFAD